MAAIYDANGVYAGEDNTGPGVRSASGLDAPTLSTSVAPANAAAAPKGDTKYTYLGLCAAMNQYEQELVQAGTVEIANVYEVKFIPASLAAAKIKIPGQTEKSLTSMQQDRTAKAVLDPSQNSMNTQGVNRSVAQGTQIIQFIEMVMRNSTFVTDQQVAVVDPVTGEATPSNSTSKNDTTQWFKISVDATPIGTTIDKKRNDWAYKLTYIVSPYQINQAESQYFPKAKFRGVHKVYNYWFTGENSQVLNYEQQFDNLYIDTINGIAPVNPTTYPDLASQITWRNKRVPITAATQSDQGADKGANNPAASLADYLYSAPDQATINIQIVGDPAWMQQGEIIGLNTLNFNFQGFYPDGTINTESQQAVFALNWNAPADYNNGTSGPQNGSGLMDVNAAATGTNNANLEATQIQQTAAYTALTVKHTFNNGKFIQDIQGALVVNLQQGELAAIAKENGRPIPSTPEIDSKIPTAGSRKSEVLSSSDNASSIPLIDQLNPAKWDQPNDIPTAPNITTTVGLETLSTQQPAEAPTSNGEVVGPAQPNTQAPRSPTREQILNQSLSSVQVASVTTTSQITAPREA